MAVEGTGSFFKLEQPLKALRLMVTHVLGRLSEVSSLQSTKALAPTATTV